MVVLSVSFFSKKLRHHDVTAIVQDHFFYVLAKFLILSDTLLFLLWTKHLSDLKEVFVNKLPV